MVILLLGGGLLLDHLIMVLDDDQWESPPIRVASTLSGSAAFPRRRVIVVGHYAIASDCEYRK